MFFALIFTQYFFAQSAMESANAFYKKGQYQEAIESYENIFRSKKHSAELYFNIGNCYYKLNNVAPAIYNFEKALLLSPNDLQAQNNLRFAQKRQIDDIKIVQKVGFDRLVSNVINTYHYNHWAWFSIGFATLFLLFFLAFYFFKKTLLKRLFFTFMVISFVSIMICVAAAFYAKKTFDNDQPAIVFAEVVAVKTEPKKEAADGFLIHEGTKVNVLESVNGYKKIELSDGKKGWIVASSIKMLK